MQLQRFAELARRMNRTESELPAALLDVVTGDPCAGAAVKAWQALVAYVPHAPETARAEAHLRESQEPATQLAFGLALGERGGAFLDAVLADPNAEVALRAQALLPRLRLLSGDDRKQCIAKVLEAPTSELLSACMEAIGDLKIPLPASALEAAFRVLAEDTNADPELMAKMVIKTARVLGDREQMIPEAEELLLTLLTIYRTRPWLLDPPGPMLGILSAIGVVGTARSVESLVQIRDQPARYFSRTFGDLKDALRLENVHSAIPERAGAIVEQIQAELLGAQAGQLSLLAPRDDEGALSLSSQAGEMSLMEVEDEDSSAY